MCSIVHTVPVPVELPDFGSGENKFSSSSVAEPDPVEAKLFETWSRSRNYILINIYCSQFGGCKDEENPPLRHVAYGTNGTVVVG